MSALYTRKVDRARLAADAMDKLKLERSPNISFPHPMGGEGKNGKITK
jgi:hypothetical protein